MYLPLYKHLTKGCKFSWQMKKGQGTVSDSPGMHPSTKSLVSNAPRKSSNVQQIQAQLERGLKLECAHMCMCFKDIIWLLTV